MDKTSFDELGTEAPVEVRWMGDRGRWPAEYGLLAPLEASTSGGLALVVEASAATFWCGLIAFETWHGVFQAFVANRTAIIFYHFLVYI